MMHLLVLLRLPVMAFGGWLAGHLYIRALWRYLERKVDHDGRDD